MDSIASTEKHTYSHVFHLAEHIQVLQAENHKVIMTLADSGFIVRLRQHGVPVKMSVIRGDKNVSGYGSISRGTNHPDATTTIEFDLTGKVGVFSAITIEDQEGFVRLGDKYAKSGLLQYSKDKITVSLGNLTISPRREFALQNL